MPITVLVTGGRDFFNRQIVNSVLDVTHRSMPIERIIHGDAPGADALADAWARGHEVDILPVAAKWDEYGRAAGPIRNREMLKMEPDVVIAFPGGKGTCNLVQQAMAAGYTPLDKFLSWKTLSLNIECGHNRATIRLGAPSRPV